MRTVQDLRPYQRRAAIRIYNRPATGLLFDLGLGKTISTLSAIGGFIRHGKRTSALVCMPLRAVDVGVWQKEAALWEHTKDLTFGVVHARNPRDPRRIRNVEKKAEAEERYAKAEHATLAELSTGAQIYITTYETLAWLARLAGTKNRKSKLKLPDILVLDESSMIKNPNSMRFKALRYRLLRYFKTVVILTGTPMPNSLLELWPQIYVLDQGQRLGTSFSRFKARFFEQTDYRGYKWEPREGAVERVLELIQDLVLRLDSKDWVRMPSVIQNTVLTALPPSIRTLYHDHERTMFTELANGKNVTAATAATLSMQCQQIAQGAIYDDPEERTSWTELHTVKLDALEELIEENTGHAIMVAYWYRHDLERLRARWPHGRVMDKHNSAQTEEDWNAGKIPLLFIQPRSSGHALNMQHGGNILVWYSLTWSLEAHDQLIGRLRRPDQKADAILSHYLVMENTVDEAIMDAIARKDRGQRTVLDALRAYALRRKT